MRSPRVLLLAATVGLMLGTGCGAPPDVPPDKTNEGPPSTPKPDTDKPAEKPTPHRVYVIKEGDSPWKISEAQYGYGLYFNNILDANKGTVKQTFLKVGQEIIIPEIPGVPFKPLPKPEDKPPFVGEPIRMDLPVRWHTPPRKHIVKQGDTLKSLAKKYYGDSDLWGVIARANDYPDALIANESIIIPEVALDKNIGDPADKPEMEGIDFLTNHIRRRALELQGQEDREQRKVLRVNLDGGDQEKVAVVYSIGCPFGHIDNAVYLAIFKRYDKARIQLVHTSYLGGRGLRHIRKVEAGDKCVIIHASEFKEGDPLSSPSRKVQLIVTMRDGLVHVDRQE